MPGLGDLFGKGSIAEQIFVWGVLNQVVGALASPYFLELTQFVNEHHPIVDLGPEQLAELVIREMITPGEGRDEAARAGINADRFGNLVKLAAPQISPADLAQMVIRNFITTDEAQRQAVLSGIQPEQFDLLKLIAADAPGPGDLAVALRRKLIPEKGAGPGAVSFEQGIREGRLGDKWTEMIKALAVQWPSPTDALNAELEGQLSHADALAEYERLGGDPQFYTWLFNSRGNAPTPNEALELLNRGIIPERGTGPASISYQQAFLEGPWRNKWLEPFLALRQYVTPPRSVVAMVRNGSLTDTKAAAELAKSGLDAELIAAYIAEGHQVAATSDKSLTQTAVLDLYSARIINADDAHGLLVALNYAPDNATYLIELADLRRSIAAVNTAVARVHTLYVGYKITRDAALTVLNSLKVPGDQVTEIIRTWDLEQGVNIKQLTEAQIVDAWSRLLFTQDQALAELQAIGYTPLDAWVLLSIKNKEALPGKPAPGPNPVGTIP